MRITLEGDDRQTLIARLGLSSDAPDSDISAAVVTRILAESAPTPEPTPPTPTPTPAPAPTPEPTPPVVAAEPPPDPDPDEEDVVIDAAAFRHLELRANRTEHLEEEARVAQRDTLIDAAIKAGKFPPSRRDHYQARFDDDADGVTARINRMKENVVPVKERGVSASEEDLAARSDEYPRDWLPEKQLATATAAPQVRQSRIHTED
jgi:hypothetical protein